MPNAQVVQVADAAAAAVLAAWRASASTPGASDGVTRSYESSLADPEFLEAFAGRQVWVFPVAYGRAALSRSQDNYRPKVTVVVAERYPDQAPVPDAWLDVRTAFVEQVVFRTLADPRNAPLLPGLTPEDDGAEVTVYDVELLVQQRLFLSFATFLFRLQYP